MSKLLIIGNGFDLNCGLPTSYKDFFEYLKTKPPFLYVPRILTSSVSFQRLTCDNTWWILFYSLSNPPENWCDIEKVMTDFLIGRDDNIYSRLDACKSADEIIGYLLGQRKDVIYLRDFSEENKIEQYFQYFNGWSKEHLPALFRFYDLMKIHVQNYSMYFSGFSITDKLSQDLNKIECAFQEYLNELDYTKWNVKSDKTINDLLKPITAKNISTYSILSFNFTRIPLDKSIQYSCVHGNYETDKTKMSKSRIIFGIDSSTMKPNDPFYSFTKTSRVMSLRIQENDDKDLIRKDIDTITIYGHSLNPQDYSYYFSIFDFVDIENKVSIILKYTLYSGCPVNYEDQLKDSLIRLVSSYAEQFNKPNKNLVHRLLLENRVRIELLRGNGI